MSPLTIVFTSCGLDHHIMSISSERTTSGRRDPFIYVPRMEAFASMSERLISNRTRETPGCAKEVMTWLESRISYFDRLLKDSDDRMTQLKGGESGPSRFALQESHVLTELRKYYESKLATWNAQQSTTRSEVGKVESLASTAEDAAEMIVGKGESLSSFRSG